MGKPSKDVARKSRLIHKFKYPFFIRKSFNFKRRLPTHESDVDLGKNVQADDQSEGGKFIGRLSNHESDVDLGKNAQPDDQADGGEVEVKECESHL
jgi:hypothetical protein